MSDELMNDISLALVIPSSVFLVALAFGSVIGVPRRVVQRRYQRQLAGLYQLAAGHTVGDRLDVEWMRYKELPKSQIMAVLGEYGWHYHGQDYENRSWLLYFARHPHPEVPTPDARLRAELAHAPEDEHHIDTTMYLDLAPTEIERIIATEGWQETRRVEEALGPRLVLTRTDPPE